jgi:hypothetical protein
MARKLLKAKQANFHRKSPFVIMLAPGTREIPEPIWDATRKTKMENQENNTDGTEQQSNWTLTPASAQTGAAKRLSAKRLGYSWNDYFTNKTDGDVWVQNLTDMQISLDIEIAPGQTQGKLIPPSPDPLNLTEEFSFEALKKSANFRRTLAKRKDKRPLLILLDSNQIEAYYSAKARQIGAVYSDGSPDLDAAMDYAEQTRRRLTTREVDGEEVNASNLHGFAPPKSAQELIALDMANRGMYAQDGTMQSQRNQAGMPANMMDRQAGGMLMEEVVNPKVLHLCQQVSPQIPAQQRMPAEQLFAALQAMQATLKLEDYQHIEASGTYRSVKNWARRKVSEMASGDEGLPDNLSLEGQGMVGQAQQQGAIQNIVPMQPGQGPQGPASLGQQGMQYQGPAGFANAPFSEAHGGAESMTGAVLGPDGSPLG